jgi:hypothetical protein
MRCLPRHTRQALALTLVATVLAADTSARSVLANAPAARRPVATAPVQEASWVRRLEASFRRVLPAARIRLDVTGRVEPTQATRPFPAPQPAPVRWLLDPFQFRLPPPAA